MNSKCSFPVYIFPWYKSRNQMDVYAMLYMLSVMKYFLWTFKVNSVLVEGAGLRALETDSLTLSMEEVQHRQGRAGFPSTAPANVLPPFHRGITHRRDWVIQSMRLTFHTWSFCWDCHKRRGHLVQMGYAWYGYLPARNWAQIPNSFPRGHPTAILR